MAPLYRRHKFDGTITNDIAYPLTRALYGVRLRQPIGGDFGFSGLMIDEFLDEPVWDSDVARFGIDIYLTTTALSRGYRVGEASLGAKIHNPKDPIGLTPMFRAVVGVMFDLAGRYYPHWKGVRGSVLPRQPGTVIFAEPQEITIDIDGLIAGYRVGWERFGALWSELLGEAQVRSIRPGSGHPPSLSARCWAHIVYTYLVAYQRYPASQRAFLLWSLVPLYQLRTACFAREAADLSNEAADRLVDRQAEIFEQLKPELVRHWELSSGTLAPASVP